MDGVVIGLDGGGTKVAVEVSSLDGIVRGRGVAGPCNVAAMPVDEALASARAAIARALAEACTAPECVRALCAGIAGASFTDRRDAFAAGLRSDFPDAAVQVLPDVAIAHTAALGGAPGIVVIAGTGSIAYGENAAGRSHRAGGYGYLIDDAGSGYGVGRAGLVAALRAADGSGPDTALREMLFRRLSLDAPADIVPLVYGGALDRVSIAALAEVVADAADSGDFKAAAIISLAGAELAGIAAAVFHKLFAMIDTVDIALVGGLWRIGGPLRETFDAHVRIVASASRITLSDAAPVTGAVRRAIDLAQPTQSR